MLEITSREELVRAIRANDVVLISYFSSDSEKNELFKNIMKELSKHLDPRILVLKVDAEKNPDLTSDVSELPCLRVYYRGRIIFEQVGFFGKPDLDVYVLRRSIRSVFHSMNIAFKV